MRDVRHLDGFEHRRVDGFRHARARSPPPRGRAAERSHRADDVLAEPSTDSQWRKVRVPVCGEAPAARLQHRFRKVETVVRSAMAEPRYRHGDQRMGRLGRAARLADDDDVGRRQPGRQVVGVLL